MVGESRVGFWAKRSMLLGLKGQVSIGTLQLFCVVS